MTIAHAIFSPPRASLIDAVREAMSNRPARSTLCTDGMRCAWLPRVPNGWEPINAAVLRMAA